jgi:hypothetical protein
MAEIPSCHDSVALAAALPRYEQCPCQGQPPVRTALPRPPLPVPTPSQYRSTSNPGLEVLRYWDGERTAGLPIPGGGRTWKIGSGRVNATLWLLSRCAGAFARRTPLKNRNAPSARLSSHAQHPPPPPPFGSSIPQSPSADDDVPAFPVQPSRPPCQSHAQRLLFLR